MFTVVLLDHGYVSTDREERVITAAGGRLINADSLPLEEALRVCEEAEAIVVRWLKITPELIQRFRRCKLIVRYGVGTDNVDLEAATEARIIVGHVPDYCIEEVSDHAVALLLACVRLVVPTHLRLANGGWEQNPPQKMWRMAGRTLGLFGFGRIGQAVARKMGAWGLRILATDPFVDLSRGVRLNVQLVDLATLCRESDYLSLHAPLLPETRHAIGRHELALLKPGANLVNTARGPVLDTEALIEALESGRLGAAGLDVFDPEPPPADSPLRKHPRVILSDHAAWYSEDSLAELHQTVAEEVVRVCTGGLPQAIANFEVLEKLGRVQEWQPNDTARWQMKRLTALGSTKA
jgi:D-3-phosphoglycerate dehydrogenase